jgi:acid phosphatase family membrane protein YuiD
MDTQNIEQRRRFEPGEVVISEVTEDDLVSLVSAVVFASTIDVITNQTESLRATTRRLVKHGLIRSSRSAFVTKTMPFALSVSRYA